MAEVNPVSRDIYLTKVPLNKGTHSRYKYKIKVDVQVREHFMLTFYGQLWERFLVESEEFFQSAVLISVDKRYEFF